MDVNDKSFVLTKESIDRIKVVANITPDCMLQRSLFMKNEGSSLLLRCEIKDIPDNFQIPINDLNSFLALVSLLESPTIAYDELASKGILKLTSSSAKSKKETFVFHKSESNLIKHNIDINTEPAFYSKITAKSNNFRITKDIIAKLKKAGAVIGADMVEFSATKDSEINIKLMNIARPGSNTFELQLSDDSIEIVDPDLIIRVSYDVFSKLEKTIDTYDVKIGVPDANGKCGLISFMEEESNVRFYMARSNKKY